MTKPKLYCKKPIVVTALQWTGNNEESICEFVGEKYFINSRGELYIETLEGILKANVGDYIVRGLAGEFYPCREDIFLNSYNEMEVGIDVGRC